MMQELDNPIMKEGIAMVDPASYINVLDKIPKLVVVSSDDEFMMFDWTSIWYDDFQKGETHLMITPNAEHSLMSNIENVLSSTGAFIRSIAAGKTRE